MSVSAFTLAAQPFQREWLILAVLTLLTGTFGIQLPQVSARVSVSEAFIFLAVILHGPAVGTVLVALDTVVLTNWVRGGRRSYLRALFNLCAGSAALWLSAVVFSTMAPPSGARLEDVFVPVMCLAACYYAVSSTLVAIAVSFETTLTPLAVWKRNFAWLSLNHLGGASVAMLLVTYRHSIDFAALLVIVPLLVITYLTFRTSLARLEDAHENVSRLNDLCLSTIEGLALAVDAKDQITHGHIRRVQVYAVEVAKRLGIKDPTQLRAIEAAALLHDMGKLAVPEHILNKPGRLTDAEFETMKQHSDIGADLLSSIRFPYPVVPIVRHHHEQWNGQGYPSGISGTDIPIGARILSVVDCFDALNSDRPYRPRLSVDDAFAILLARRGTMYDPLVVDLFVKAYPEIAEIAQAAGHHGRSLSTVADPRERALSSTTSPLTTPLGFRNRNRSGSVTKAFDAVNKLMPSTAAAYFEYRVDTNQLVCAHVSREWLNPLLGMTMRPGERVTGWAAANLKTVSNSDATLDLGDTVRRLSVPIRNMMSTPILCTKHAELCGVLSGYSQEAGAFSVESVRLFETLSTELAEQVPEPRAQSRSPLPFLPNAAEVAS